MPNRNDWVIADRTLCGILIALGMTGAALAILALLTVCAGLVWAIAHIVRDIF